MPPSTKKQARFLGADLQRAREGKKTRSGMSKAELEEYLRKRKKRK